MRLPSRGPINVAHDASGDNSQGNASAIYWQLNQIRPFSYLYTIAGCPAGRLIYDHQDVVIFDCAGIEYIKIMFRYQACLFPISSNMSTTL